MMPPRERKTTSGWFAVILALMSFLLISIAMFTRNWMQAESKVYGTSMQSLGLWWQCLRSFTVNKDLHSDRFFVGCRWIFDRFTTGYDDVREMLATPSAAFFVTVQVFYTVCFVMSLVATGMALALILCPGEKFEGKILKVGYISLFGAFGTGFIAITVFGSMATMEGWMPHPDHNLLSWSYAVAVVGVVLSLVAGILFWVECQIQRRKESYRNAHGAVQMEVKA